MNVRGLDVHLDGCGLDVFSDLEKDFLFGADVQSGDRESKSAAVFIRPGTWAILK